MKERWMESWSTNGSRNHNERPLPRRRGQPEVIRRHHHKRVTRHGSSTSDPSDPPVPEGLFHQTGPGPARPTRRQSKGKPGGRSSVAVGILVALEAIQGRRLWHGYGYRAKGAELSHSSQSDW